MEPCREALRETALGRVIAGAATAITESTAGPMVLCDGITGARADGYSLVTLTPTAAGLVVEGYYAQSISDYARQGIALLRRDFREGPHDDLGTHEQITVRAPEASEMGLLVDGEPSDGAPTIHFRIARAEVDLLATAPRRAPGPLPAGLG